MAGVATYRQADATVNAAITQLKGAKQTTPTPLIWVAQLTLEFSLPHWAWTAELLGVPKESYSKSAVDTCTHGIERVAAADGLDGGQLVALARITAEAKGAT